ncbi:MAG: hypothetical protein KDC44_05940 [Phaeodactylibacter sp.]|nr:hypothetical protein [Phaeodactylibacter sp.]
MKNTIVFACFALLFTSCEGPPVATDIQGDRQFYMPQPSFLYFKNMRSTKYRETLNSSVNEPIFEFRRWERSSIDPQFIPQIVCRLLTDEAFLRLQPNAIADQCSKPFQIRMIGNSADTTLMELSLTSVQDQTKSARLLAAALEAGSKIEIQETADSWFLLFQPEKDRQYFRITLSDYENLLN